jgi:hypothetical protein
MVAKSERFEATPNLSGLVVNFNNCTVKKNDWKVSLSYEGDGLVGKFVHEQEKEDADVPLLKLKVYHKDQILLDQKCYMRLTDKEQKIKEAADFVLNHILNYKKEKDKFFFESLSYLHINRKSKIALLPEYGSTEKD